MGHCHRLRWGLRRPGVLVCAVLAMTLVVASPAWASAPGARLYVAVGDSVGAGFGATPGHSFFDRYCAYLKSPAGGSLVDQCVNESAVGLTSQSALDGATIQKVVNDIAGSTDTPVVTVVLGANDLLGSPGCQPITAAGCSFMSNMRTILDQVQTALAGHPGPHVIQWLEYYNPNHDNPFANASADHSTAALLLGDDLALTDCTSHDPTLIGLNDAINCIARQKGAIPVDAYSPFQDGCASRDCFADALHPDDKGYGLIFAALRDSLRPSGGINPPPAISALSATPKVFAPADAHHRGGTVFSFRLDQRARITIAIERRAAGRRVGRSCRRPVHRMRHRPRCTRAILIATLSEHGHTGLNTVAFSGRVRGRALMPGRYLAVLAATNAAGTSRAQTLHFTIIDSTHP